MPYQGGVLHNSIAPKEFKQKNSIPPKVGEREKKLWVWGGLVISRRTLLSGKKKKEFGGGEQENRVGPGDGISVSVAAEKEGAWPKLIHNKGEEREMNAKDGAETWPTRKENGTSHPGAWSNNDLGVD